jgi:hypothetical protein
VQEFIHSSLDAAKGIRRGTVGGLGRNERDWRDMVVNIGRNPKEGGQTFYDAELHR